jgi:hypothetical protein
MKEEQSSPPAGLRLMEQAGFLMALAKLFAIFSIYFLSRGTITYI